MNIVIAPDSFKGSAMASEVARAMARGALDSGDHVVREMPMADGGEGSLEIVATAWALASTAVDTVDALGRPLRSTYIHDFASRTAVIEVAGASGLPQVGDVPPAPMTANTEGTGIVLRHAIAAGAETIYLCLGGSATVDGGIGIISALGGKFFDVHGDQLQPTPRNLINIVDVDTSDIDSSVGKVKWVLAVDVDNPLVGADGAAAVFGPQKGADPAQIRLLDEGLLNLSQVLEDQSGQPLQKRAGFGAAGGIPAIMTALFSARLIRGAEMIADLVQLSQALEDADLVITGEGRFDSQSANGKVVSLVAKLAKAAPKAPPVLVIAGQVSIQKPTLDEMGVTAAFSIANGPQPLEEMVLHTLPQIRTTTSNAVALVASRHVSDHINPKKNGTEK